MDFKRSFSFLVFFTLVSSFCLSSALPQLKNSPLFKCESSFELTEVSETFLNSNVPFTDILVYLFNISKPKYLKVYHLESEKTFLSKVTGQNGAIYFGSDLSPPTFLKS